MALRQYEEAELSFLNAQNYAPIKSINYYLLNLYRTINYLHAGKYQKAYTLYRENKKCSFEIIREQFAIIEAYLCFLSCMGYLQLEKNFASVSISTKIFSDTTKSREITYPSSLPSY